MGSIAVFIPFVALSIPIIAIIMSHRSGSQKNKLKELELKKEILELEIKKQDSTIKLLEEENKKYDNILKNELK
jgi:hypothetical protein